VRGLALAIPIILGLGAIFVAPTAPLRRAQAVCSLAFWLSLLVAAGGLAAGAAGAMPGPAGRVDPVTGVMLVLVGFIGLVIARYSRTYLQWDPGEARYARWLLATLGAVTALVTARHLLVIALAWTATSLSLHRLLTFYEDRTAAVVAAHKKFLVSRLADACLWGALGLIHHAVGSLDLDEIAAWAGSQATLPAGLQLATVLLVVAASLKSAQLPFHGWLTQVMEAPTPVSALLHAGVVNLGGFLMIRLAPLMARAPGAQLLLVVIGTTTAVLAALVMTTRVSVKVALAWSTCAQMGFMLAECGLGAWPLALLHLVAHSLYKAHAFLNAGSAVEIWRGETLTGGRSPVTPGQLAVAGALGPVLAVIAGGAASSALGKSWHDDPSIPALSLLVALSVAPLLARAGGGGGRLAAELVARGLGVAALYAGWHAAAGRLFPAPVAPSAQGWIVLVSGFVFLFAVQTALQLWPDGRLARALHPWLFAGFYLDERFTRLTFRVWPPRLPAPAPIPPLTLPRSVETT
jgi:NAD(P)H-quinone oxidoreductase subunit 5